MEIRSLGPAPGTAGERERLRTAAREFEAVLLEMLLKEARRTTDGAGSSDFARGVFEEWQDGQLADRMSAAGGIGLADLLLQQWAPGKRP